MKTEPAEAKVLGLGPWGEPTAGGMRVVSYYVECASCDAGYDAEDAFDGGRWMKNHDNACTGRASPDSPAGVS